jgi:hypothetical protein
MELDLFVFYIQHDNNKGKVIILKEDIDLITLQKYICKRLKNCFLFINYYDNYYDNIIYQKYNNNIFGIIKQSNNIFYIWKINL